MVNKNIVIDNSSIYLIIISIVVAIIPDGKDIFDRLKKIKTNNFELEFTLKDLLGKVEELEENIDECIEENIDKNKLNYGGLDASIIEKFEKVASEPNALILLIGVEIENRINKLLNEFGLDEKRFMSVMKSINKLCELKIINIDVSNLISGFTSVRSKVAHGVYKNDEISQSQLYAVAEIGIRVLNILPTEIII